MDNEPSALRWFSIKGNLFCEEITEVLLTIEAYLEVHNRIHSLTFHTGSKLYSQLFFLIGSSLVNALAPLPYYQTVYESVGIVGRMHVCLNE